MCQHLFRTTMVVLVFSATNSRSAELEFEKQLLMVSPNEGCAVADVNRDGHLDVVAGPHWFAGPDFVGRPLRELREFSDDYLANNGDHLYDVNGDGWLDVISGEWSGPDVYWFENPGQEKLRKGLKWKPHLLQNTRSENEAFFLRDLDGDQVPEIIVDCWQDDAPLIAWKFASDGEQRPTLERRVLGQAGCGHGMAFGDVNGDGREDILTKVGWYERPAGDPWAAPWTLHRDWDRPHGSTPFLVVDLNADGRNDLIWGDGHGFGLYWLEQGEPTAEGQTTWTEHLIDDSYSQTHCLHWADLDRDGKPELITGKRVRGHAGNDPGGWEPECLYRYSWDVSRQKFKRHTISEAAGIGTGMQIHSVDFNGDGWLDLAVSGKTGTWVLLNRGTGS